MHVRLVRADDLEPLVELAKSADGSMTTMPTSHEGMKARIDKSLASADPNRTVDGHEAYVFVLIENDRILGMSAIYAAVGLERPFYNYKVSSLSQTSPELGVRVDTRLLHLVNDYTGCSVVGTLFLHPDGRGGGRGRLLSLSRFMFMAAHRDRFATRVIAEMRGFTESDGGSKFWNAVGRRFFQLEFSDADLRSGHEFRFISDLFPTYPIYADLLPQEAQDVIGIAHPEAEPAAALLEEQGMRNRNYVDIFDAGLCLDAHIDDLEIVRSARPASITRAGAPTPAVASGTGSSGTGSGRLLVADPSLEGFAVTMSEPQPFDDQIAPSQIAAGQIAPTQIALSDDALATIGWSVDQSVLVAPAKRTRR